MEPKVDPIVEPLSFYGSESECGLLDWQWTEQQLQAAGTYWVVPRSPAMPHPRPVWGVWHERRLLLSVGSLVLARCLAADATVTVHLESGTDVVIVEGRADGHSDSPAAITEYDRKYDWHYDVAEYGPLTVVSPIVVRAWRAGGWAGRDGFQSAGRWRL